MEEGEVQEGCEVICGSPSTTPGSTQKMLSFVHLSHIVASPKKICNPKFIITMPLPIHFQLYGKEKQM